MDHIQIQIKDLTTTLDTNQWVIDNQLNGLTHEDTLLQLPFRGNCMNWVLGHLAEHRDKMLRVLGLNLLMMPEQAALYARGSDPITDPSHALHLDQIIHHLITAKETLVNTLNTFSEAYLLEMADEKSGRTRLQRVQGLVWRETYHLGQLEILRQLAGTNDKII